MPSSTSIAPGATPAFEAQRERGSRGVHERGTCVVESGCAVRRRCASRRPPEHLDSTVVVTQSLRRAAWRLRGPAGWPAPLSVGDVSCVRDYKPGRPAAPHPLEVGGQARSVRWSATSTARYDGFDRGDADVRRDRRRRRETPLRRSRARSRLSALREGDVSVGRGPRASVGRDPRVGGPARSRRRSWTSSLDGRRSADAVVYVGPASLVPVDRLTAIAVVDRPSRR